LKHAIPATAQRTASHASAAARARVEAAGDVDHMAFALVVVDSCESISGIFGADIPNNVAHLLVADGPSDYRSLNDLGHVRK
jgi:hypothetical protein